jgi:FixJ family two-component response regulator
MNVNDITVPTVFVIDDDPCILKALARLLHSCGLNVTTFASPQEFLDKFDPNVQGCLILDVEMPDLNGIELQQQLATLGHELPIIFLTGHGDIPMSVQAMKLGAVDFLTKPVQDHDLIDAIHAALEKNLISLRANAELSGIKKKLATLTPREQEVLSHVVSGRLNKQIAADLGTGEKTIKVHRAHLMKKLQVRSVADLVRLTERAGVATIFKGPREHEI